MKKTIATFTVIVCAFVLAFPIRQSFAQATPLDHSAGPVRANTNLCQTVMTRAMDTLQSTCTRVGRNKACYGNNLVKADTQAQFSNVGDITNISEIHSLSTAPLDEQNGIWGLTLLKMQANLPDSLPGQNVTFLVFGNTHIDNTSGDMRSFYFTSGLGASSCKEAPTDSIIVKSPNHMKVTFNANGTQITIASTVVLRAEKGNQMTVALVEGHAHITTPQGSLNLKPGQQVSVLLGGQDGLTPVSAPSTLTNFIDGDDPAMSKMIAIAQAMGTATGSDNVGPDAAPGNDS